jgi:hypothetical protein
VHHLARARHVLDASELHPLDVADRRYSQSLHSSRSLTASAVAEIPSPSQIRDLMPFASLIGIDLLDVTPELVRARLE